MLRNHPWIKTTHPNHQSSHLHASWRPSPVGGVMKGFQLLTFLSHLQSTYVIMLVACKFFENLRDDVEVFFIGYLLFKQLFDALFQVSLYHFSTFTQIQYNHNTGNQYSTKVHLILLNIKLTNYHLSSERFPNHRMLPFCNKVSSFLNSSCMRLNFLW